LQSLDHGGVKKGTEKFAEEEEAYNWALNEIVTQVTTHCFERGALLKRVLNWYLEKPLDAIAHARKENWRRPVKEVLDALEVKVARQAKDVLDRSEEIAELKVQRTHMEDRMNAANVERDKAIEEKEKTVLRADQQAEQMDRMQHRMETLGARIHTLSEDIRRLHETMGKKDKIHELEIAKWREKERRWLKAADLRTAALTTAQDNVTKLEDTLRDLHNTFAARRAADAKVSKEALKEALRQAEEARLDNLVPNESQTDPPPRPPTPPQKLEAEAQTDPVNIAPPSRGGARAPPARKPSLSNVASASATAKAVLAAAPAKKKTVTIAPAAIAAKPALVVPAQPPSRVMSPPTPTRNLGIRSASLYTMPPAPPEEEEVELVDPVAPHIDEGHGKFSCCVGTHNFVPWNCVPPPPGEKVKGKKVKGAPRLGTLSEGDEAIEPIIGALDAKIEGKWWMDWDDEEEEEPDYWDDWGSFSQTPPALWPHDTLQAGEMRVRCPVRVDMEAQTAPKPKSTSVGLDPVEEIQPPEPEPASAHVSPPRSADTSTARTTPPTPGSRPVTSPPTPNTPGGSSASVPPPAKKKWTSKLEPLEDVAPAAPTVITVAKETQTEKSFLTRRSEAKESLNVMIDDKERSHLIPELEKVQDEVRTASAKIKESNWADAALFDGPDDDDLDDTAEEYANDPRLASKKELLHRVDKMLKDIDELEQNVRTKDSTIMTRESELHQLRKKLAQLDQLKADATAAVRAKELMQRRLEAREEEFKEHVDDMEAAHTAERKATEQKLAELADSLGRTELLLKNAQGALASRTTQWEEVSFEARQLKEEIAVADTKYKLQIKGLVDEKAKLEADLQVFKLALTADKPAGDKRPSIGGRGGGPYGGASPPRGSISGGYGGSVLKKPFGAPASPGAGAAGGPRNSSSNAEFLERYRADVLRGMVPEHDLLVVEAERDALRSVNRDQKEQVEELMALLKSRQEEHESTITTMEEAHAELVAGLKEEVAASEAGLVVCKDEFALKFKIATRRMVFTDKVLVKFGIDDDVKVEVERMLREEPEVTLTPRSPASPKRRSRSRSGSQVPTTPKWDELGNMLSFPETAEGAAGGSRRGSYFNAAEARSRRGSMRSLSRRGSMVPAEFFPPPVREKRMRRKKKKPEAPPGDGEERAGTAEPKQPAEGEPKEGEPKEGEETAGADEDAAPAVEGQEEEEWETDTSYESTDDGEGEMSDEAWEDEDEDFDASPRANLESRASTPELPVVEMSSLVVNMASADLADISADPRRRFTAKRHAKMKPDNPQLSYLSKEERKQLETRCRTPTETLTVDRSLMDTGPALASPRRPAIVPQHRFVFVDLLDPRYGKAEYDIKPVAWLLRIMDGIYEDKIVMDASDSRENLPPLRMPVFIFQWLTQRYGLKPLIEQGCWDIQVAVDTYCDTNEEVEMFRRFMDEEYNLAQCTFMGYLRTFIRTVCSDKPPAGLGSIDLTIGQAKELSRCVFSHINPDRLELFMEALDEIAFSSLKFMPKTKAINAQDYMAMVAQEYGCQQVKYLSILEEAAHTVDTDADGILSREQLVEVLRSVMPNCTDHEVRELLQDHIPLPPQITIDAVKAIPDHIDLPGLDHPGVRGMWRESPRMFGTSEMRALYNLVTYPWSEFAPPLIQKALAKFGRALQIRNAGEMIK